MASSTTRSSRDWLFLQNDCSAGDSGNVQEVINDPGHVLDLLADHVDGPREIGAVRAFDSHDLNGVADWRQRVSQLVGEHGEEMVLADPELRSASSIRLRSSMSAATEPTPRIVPSGVFTG